VIDSVRRNYRKNIVESLQSEWKPGLSRCEKDTLPFHFGFAGNKKPGCAVPDLPIICFFAFLATYFIFCLFIFRGFGYYNRLMPSSGSNGSSEHLKLKDDFFVENPLLKAPNPCPQKSTTSYSFAAVILQEA
jgi:hypothetical protein